MTGKMLKWNTHPNGIMKECGCGCYDTRKKKGEVSGRTTSSREKGQPEAGKASCGENCCAHQTNIEDEK